ncbi:MAG: hypothetical protein GC178_08535 [Flavobacteriales bacterium]|nr:hypothetical protein [Flavobacteriales bacterium]
MRPLLMSLSIAALTFAAIGCKSNKDTTTSTGTTKENPATMQTEPQLLASIERTACYGQCPMYKATFFDNGEVKYVGKRFVENVGTYRTLISAEDVQDIKKKITESDYFGLDSLYPTPIADFPSCITEANLNGTRKKVIDRRSPPDNLLGFERFLDSLLKDREWEKVSDNTDYDPAAK